MSSIEEKYKFTTTEESILDKDWAAGSSTQIESKEFVICNPTACNTSIQYIGSYKTMKYPPALWKIIDEPIVNALDHLMRCSTTDHKVTKIKVSIDLTGRIRIYNNGPGIEIAIHKIASEKLGRDIYLPTFLFGILFQGENRYKSKDCIIGGTNGLGAKLSNCFSKQFAIETVDNRKYFLQQWKNHKSVEDKPIIINITQPNQLSKEKTESHTTLSFIPDYTELFNYKEFSIDVYNDLADLIRTRMVFASAYARYSVTHPIEIWFNNENINVNVAEIAKILFPNSIRISTEITPKITKYPEFRYPWQVCAVITDTTIYDTPHISNVNGIVVKDGKHIRWLYNTLIENIKDKISKICRDKNIKFSSTHITGNVFLVINAQIPNPSWTGQRKDILDMDIRKFSGYTFNSKFINQITEHVKDKIIDSILTTIPSVKKRDKVEYDKYHPASESGVKFGSKCSLIITEGDSAMQWLSTGISNSIGWEYYGVMSTRGVIINVRKECSILDTPAGKQIKKSNKLLNNIFINALYDIVGLNPNYKYDPTSPSYKKEMSALKYGHVIACVDQDLDGKGNILGLIINLFELFFPNLLKSGYVQWFCTPIVRAYPKSGGNVMSFYSLNEYQKWKLSLDESKYNIRYYKGIGTHSRDELLNMCTKFTKYLFTYKTDENTHKLLDIYFGQESDARKLELATPLAVISNEDNDIQFSTKSISCSDHLKYETKQYQLDNLHRKLNHAIDGQNQAGRKILNGCLKTFTNGKILRVDELAGFISASEKYHHGIENLHQSITGRGFLTVGGEQLPLIIPLSNFGSRKEGGGDASAARYISAKLNYRLTDLIYPEEDYHILQFNFDEGTRIEPKYFVPIIPMVIFYSAVLPAHGWKIKLWARDVFKGIENVRRLIHLSDTATLIPMPPCTYKGSIYEWKGTFKTIRGKPYSFGVYSYNAHSNTITITELPLRVWTVPYLRELKDKKAADSRIIDRITDSSDDLAINIIITLKPDAMDLIDTYADSVFTTGVEEYFHLRKKMDSFINLIGSEGEVQMYDTYEDVVYPWFKIRKEYYIQRISRKKILLSLRIKHMENIIRYVENSIKMNLPKRRYAEMESQLEIERYDKINESKLKQPKFTPTDKLEDVILHGPKATYLYLLDISDRKKSAESLTSYIAKRDEYIEELSDLNKSMTKGRFPGASIWLDELDKLEKVITEGNRTKWLFEDYGKFKFT